MRIRGIARRGAVIGALALAAVPLASTASASLPPSAPPPTPTGVSLISQNRSLAVSWSDGAAGRATYTATATSPGRATRSCPAKRTACSISALVNGVVYDVTVVAAIGKASSDPSVPVSATVGVPGPPLSVRATGGVASVAVSWSPPKASGVAGVTAYMATADPGGFSCSTAKTALASPTRTCQIPGLSPGLSYTITVTATNAEGTGPPSKPVTARAAG